MKALAVCGLLLSGFCAATAWACPPVPEAARLQLLSDRDELEGYAMLRVIKCGWLQSMPVVQAWRDARHAEDAQDGGKDFIDAFMMLTRFNPGRMAIMGEDLAQDVDEDTPREMGALARLKVSSVGAAAQFEQGLEPAIAWLRGSMPLDAQTELHLELSLAAQEIRQGRLDAARLRLAAARHSFTAAHAADADAADAAEELKEFEQLLAPPRVQSPAADAQWVLNRGPGRRFCGTGAFMETLFGKAYLREHVLRNADAELALGELLAEDWHAQIDRGARHTEFLALLLKQRYGRKELRQGWDDALASLRNDETVTGLTVFGHFLPLPAGVIEIAAAEPEKGARRRLSDAELVELVRNTPLYKATNPG